MVTPDGEVHARRERPLLERHRAAVELGLLASLLAAGFLIFAFMYFKETSFAVNVKTTSIRFTAETAAVDSSGNDGGLFAPSGLITALIDGGKLQPLNGSASLEDDDATHHRLEHVTMDTLLFGPGSQVSLSVQAGTAKIWLKEKVGAQSIRVVFNGSGTSHGEQWMASPAHSILTLTLIPEEQDALRADSNVRLQKGSTLYLKSNDDESPFVGTDSVLMLPRLTKKIKLTDSRLEVRDLTSARIRRISWNLSSSGKIASMSTTVTGRSDAINVFGPYSEEASNEALNLFDSFTHGRTGRLLASILGCSGLGTLFSVVFRREDLKMLTHVLPKVDRPESKGE